MSLSTFLLGLFIFLQSAVMLGWFAVADKFLGLVGLAFVIVLLVEYLWQPITLRKP